MVPQDFPRYNLEEMLKIQRTNIQGFKFMCKGCRAINNISKKGPNLCKAMSKNKLGPSCAKLGTARNNYSLLYLSIIECCVVVLTLAFIVCFQYLQICNIYLRDFLILVFSDFLNKGLRDFFN